MQPLTPEERLPSYINIYREWDDATLRQIDDFVFYIMPAESAPAGPEARHSPPAFFQTLYLFNFSSKLSFPVLPPNCGARPSSRWPLLSSSHFSNSLIYSTKL